MVMPHVEIFRIYDVVYVREYNMNLFRRMTLITIIKLYIYN